MTDNFSSLRVMVSEIRRKKPMEIEGKFSLLQSETLKFLQIFRYNYLFTYIYFHNNLP